MTPFLSLADWNEPLPADERDRLLNSIADTVVGRGLQTPAILALEMHKPLAFVASQSLIVGTPLLGPLIGLERMQRLSRFLAQPGSVDDLVARIEQRTAAAAAVDANPGREAA